MMGLSTTSGRSVPLPWLVVNVICQLLNRCTESATYGSISSGVLPVTEESEPPPV